MVSPLLAHSTSLGSRVGGVPDSIGLSIVAFAGGAIAAFYIWSIRRGIERSAGWLAIGFGLAVAAWLVFTFQIFGGGQSGMGEAMFLVGGLWAFGFVVVDFIGDKLKWSFMPMLLRVVVVVVSGFVLVATGVELTGGSALRSLDLAGGASPILPMILLTGVPAVWCGLWGENKIKGIRLPIMLGLITVVILLLSGYYGRIATPVRTLEGVCFDLAISAAIAMAAFLVMSVMWDLLSDVAVTHENEPRAAGTVEDSAGAAPNEAPVGAQVATEKSMVALVHNLWVVVESTASSLQPKLTRLRDEAKQSAVVKLMFVNGSLLAMFVAMMNYPFQPERPLLVGVGLLLLVSAALSTAVSYRQLKAKGDEGGMARFIPKIIGFVIVPVLAAISGRFPSVLDQLSVITGPLFRILF